MVALSCGSCRACCQWGGQADAIKPSPHLTAKPNGDCYYLTADGCSIWGTEIYPCSCMDFDCRDFAVDFLDKLGFDSCLKAVIIAGLRKEK